MISRFNKFMQRGPLLAIAMLSTNLLFAQQFGAHVGSTFSYYTNNFSLQGGSPGLLVGGIVNYPLSDNLQLTGGLDYVQMKGAIHNTPTSITLGPTSYLRVKSSNITIHGVEASALAAYKLPLGFLGDAAPSVVGGFSVAYNAGMWDNYSVDYLNAEGITTFRGTENVGSLATTDWIPAWNVGLRFQAPLDGGLFSAMLLDLRMKSSFNSVLNQYPLNGSAEELGIKSFSASIGFMF